MRKAVWVAAGLCCLVLSASRLAARPGRAIAPATAPVPRAPAFRPPSSARRTPSPATAVTRNGCKAITMVYARGTWEPGKLGLLGPLVVGGLRSRFPSIAVEGVAYAAGVATNALPDGADPSGVSEMKRLVRLFLSRCPKSAIIIGGYSQGAAIVHQAARGLSRAEKTQVFAAFLFGDTRFAQDGGRIPGFPSAKTIIVCNNGDEVCRGRLLVLPAHLSYGPRVDEVVAFLSRKLIQAGVGSA
ncbi:cutinase [Colletotrichum salicis]|uniref:Cutinase n=1 Tax=Colletotrichum salicis TaxID=1209931 RepID=A0A135V0D0_9PEZI|nr:cutinase [Colletotrichum salicis]